MNVASEVETQYNWVDNKRTDEVVGYKLYFVQEGVNPFAVKFFGETQASRLLVGSEV